MSDDALPARTASDPATPLGRLIAAILVATAGSSGAIVAPINLLLTVHIVNIAGPGSAASFGIVAGAGALAAIVANPLAGRLSDRTTARLGRRRTWILGAALLGGVTLAAILLTTEVWQVVIAWAIVQAAFTVQVAIASTLLADQVPPERRGGVSGLMGLGLTIFPLVVLGVVGAVGESPLQWVICASVGLLGGVVAVLLLREHRHVPDANADTPRLSVRELLGSYWLDPRRHPAFGWAWLTRFLLYCTFGASAFTAFLLLDKFGLTTEQLAPTVTGLAGIQILGIAATSVASGFLSDRLKRQKPFVIVGGMFAALGALLTVFAPSLEFLYLSFAVSAIGAGCIYSVDNALCVRMLPSADDAAKDYGIINLASGLPQSVVPFVAPALLALGGYPVLFVTLAVLGVVGAVTVIRLPEIGREGDPRWAPITRGETVPTGVAS